MNLDTGCVGHAIKDLKPTTPDLKAGHPVCYSSIVCVCVCVFVRWGFLGFLSPPFYCFASALYTFIVTRQD